jgi:UDP-N-acetylglucosamine 4,6-dehydratase
MYKKKSLLITGGTGSFGKYFIKYVTSRKISFKKIIIFSRDEFKQSEMAKEFSISKYPFLRYFLGDIRDKERLQRALNDVDFVVHAAALKQVPTAEYNPWEYIKTNIIGTANLIDASLDGSVSKIIALSTDKAAAPVNLYGATKLCSDKLFIAANNVVGKKNKSFSVVRYGNVMNSRGSVIPLFKKQRENGLLTITHKEMTRFNISLEDAVKMVFWSIENLVGGEILVPKIPSYRIMDLAKVIAPNAKYKILGIRPGEKIHEELITKTDSEQSYDLGLYYAIVENLHSLKFLKRFPKAKKVKKGFYYTSDNNRRFLSVNELQKLLKDYL